MYPLLKRPSSDSPRSPNSQASPSNPMTKKFKTPMMFTPSGAPSPSRRELWKQELGLDDNESDDPLELSSDEDEPEADQNEHKRGGHSNAEFEALEIELERKEKQKEELLIKLKDAADKINSYRAKAEHYQQAQRNQLKIMKKTYETYLGEKEETIQTLHEHIEEQDNIIIDLHAKLVGESSTDDDISVSTYRSVKKLSDKLGTLQQEKAHLTATLMKTEGRMAKLEEEKDHNNNKMEDEKNNLERAIRKIRRENEELKGSQLKCNGTDSNCKDIINELESEKQNLNKKIKELEEQLMDHQRKNQDWEHRFESEISHLRENIAQAEAKYKEVAAAPPKTIVKTVVSEKQTQQLEELQNVKQELESKHAASQVLMNKLEEQNETLSADLKKSTSQYEAIKRELESKIKFEELYQECKTKLSFMESELQRKIDQHSKEVNESREREQQLRNQIEKEKEKAEEEARLKYSKFINKFEVLKKIIKEIAETFVLLKKDQHFIKSEMNTIRKSIKPSMEDAQKAISHAIKDLNERSRILVERYRKEMKLRKKFHNELVEIKGNIRVFCRVRPVIHEDGSGQQAENVVTFDHEDDGVLFVDHRNNLKQFEVDRVFTPKSTQLQVFNEVKSLVTSCIDGFNVCIFAYGQTGSGKTFTMEGTTDDPGINQRALQLLFGEIADRLDWQYKLSVSMLEIYNESLRDLLSSSNAQPLDIKQSKDGVFVPGLNEVDVSDVDDVNKVFSLGHKNRSTASTNMNEHSSRSHAILVINIVGVNKNTGTKTIGKLNLVDLAGSERVSKSGAEGARMKEAQNINRSLSALGDVIHALKSKNSHIPYRNTKLTYLLQDSLGGDSKTLMVVQVAPVRKNAGETYCSLDFAQRVRNVELGQASRRVESADRNHESSGTPKGRTPKKRL